MNGEIPGGTGTGGDDGATAGPAGGATGPAGGAPRGRPRSAEADRAILAATADLLAERGLAAMSIEEVAARAGVGKTTIYRRWPSKGLLALDAFVISFRAEQPQPDTGSLRGDLLSALHAWVRAVTQTAMRVVREVSGAHGFNIGMNQGSVAGAGIADHLPQHAVPRWGGDTNFMPVVGLTRVLPQVLAETRALLASAWPAVPGGAPAGAPPREA